MPSGAGRAADAVRSRLAFRHVDAHLRESGRQPAAERTVRQRSLKLSDGPEVGFVVGDPPRPPAADRRRSPRNSGARCFGDSQDPWRTGMGRMPFDQLSDAFVPPASAAGLSERGVEKMERRARREGQRANPGARLPSGRMLFTETSVQCPTSCFALTFFSWDIALPASKARLNAAVARIARMLRRSMVFLSLERLPGGELGTSRLKVAC